ncbi:MAG: hypothetical protein CMJ23_11855 [Phycisphaerae bacterium]|nr:hypothetical protein [Phycisphaerae bacterium]
MIGRKIRRSFCAVTEVRFVDRAVRVIASIVAIGLTGTVGADECPSPLIPMPAIVDAGPSDLIRRRPFEMTQTRVVYADYIRSSRSSDRVIDIGTAWMENLSPVRRRLRYHHEFPVDRRPRLLFGEIEFVSTRAASFDLRIGCHPLNPAWSYHAVEGEGDRLVMRIEAVLAPGERVLMWWSVDLDIVVAGELPDDRDGDGDLDMADLVAALSELGRGDPDEEVNALRSLVLKLGSGGDVSYEENDS